MLRPAKEEPDELVQRVEPPWVRVLVEVLEPRPLPLLPVQPEWPVSEPVVPERPRASRVVVLREPVEPWLREYERPQYVYQLLKDIQKEPEQERPV